MNILSYAQIKYGLNTLHLYRFTHTAYMGIYFFFFFFLRECLMIIQMSWKKQSKIKSTHTVTQTIAPSA